MDIELKADKSEKGVNGELSWKQVFKQNKAKYTVTGKLDVKGTVTATTEVENLQEGLTLEATGKLYSEKPKDDSDSVTLGAKYKNKNFNLTESVKLAKGAPVGITSSVVGTYKGFSLGAQAKLSVNLNKPAPVADEKTEGEKKKEEQVKLDSYDFVARYDVDKLSLIASVEKSLSNVKVGYVQQVRDDLTVGAEFAQDVATKGAKPSLTGAVARTIDNESSVASKLTVTDGDFSVAYKLKVNKDLETLMTVRSNLFSFKDSKVGVSFTYAPKQ